MKVLVLANFGMGLYNFRKELLEELINLNYEVYISLPDDEYVPKLEAIGCKFINTPISRRGTNPLTDFKLLMNYKSIIKNFKPDVVLTYTIKPNIYGGLMCRMLRVPYISTITGLGTSIENNGIIQKISLFLYKVGLSKSRCIIFQNENNMRFLKERKVIKSKTKLVPGSGVNLETHSYEEYPDESENITFLFIGRIMEAKGIIELLNAAKEVKKVYPKVQFKLVGPLEENYSEIINEFEESNIIKHYGLQSNVHQFIANCHAVINPSHHEGMSNVLLESASTGRPVIASNIPGCKETFDEGVSGIGFEIKNKSSLVESIIKFYKLPYEKKKQMGISGRQKMETEFDRKQIVSSYINELENAVYNR